MPRWLNSFEAAAISWPIFTSLVCWRSKALNERAVSASMSSAHSGVSRGRVANPFSIRSTIAWAIRRRAARPSR